ncbi:MAG: DMT family transporter [Clostridia bacterium]|nr:DMT family transporter [Clostridia bacterium]
MKGTLRDRLLLGGAMTVFGTIGIFRHYIPLPSATVALARSAIGALFLLLCLAVLHRRPDFGAVRKNLGYLLASGVFLGFNWVLLFEAYKYTTVAAATLSYYMAPIILVLVAPLFLGECLTLKKGICALVALGGMVLVSGIFEVGFSGGAELIGIGLGLAAACLYAAIIIFNKKMRGIDAMTKTLCQFAVSAAVLLPYVLIAEDITREMLTPLGISLLLVVCVVHTGLAYVAYFGSVRALPSDTVAIFSYIDPVLAVLLSALFLKEPMTPLGIVGAVLVLGAAFLSEYTKQRKTDD